MAVTNLNQFRTGFVIFERSIPIKLQGLQKRKAIAVLTRLVRKTPRRKGRARANWRVSLNKQGSGWFKKKTDFIGQETIDKGIAKIRSIPKALYVRGIVPIIIFNNAPYIKKLEMGSSSQAPNGMMVSTLAELGL